MTRSATAEAAARLLASPRPYTVTTLAAKNDDSAKFRASQWAIVDRRPLFLQAFEGHPVAQFDADGSLVWSSSCAS